MIDVLASHYLEYANADFMGRMQVISRFLPWLLISLLVISKLFKKPVKSLYPILLCTEYTIWPVWFYYIQDELLGYIAYLVVYSVAIRFLLKYTTDRFAKYVAFLYVLSSVVVVLNLFAYMVPNIPVVQFFYDAYFEMMSLIMITMAFIGLVAMYDNGNGAGRHSFKLGGDRFNKIIYNDMASIEIR